MIIRAVESSWLGERRGPVTSTRSLCHRLYAAYYQYIGYPHDINSVWSGNTLSLTSSSCPCTFGKPLALFFSFLEAAFLLLMFQRAEKKRSHGDEVRLFHRQPYIGKNNFSDLHSEGKLQKKKNSSRSNNFQEQIYMHQKNLRG